MRSKMLTSTLQRNTRNGMVALAVAGALALTAAGVASPALANQPQPSKGPGTSEFKGVNWADPRDNYASDAVVPTGLSSSDSYDQVLAASRRILGGFEHNLSANTVRLPINPASVGTAWWNSYRATIDAAAARGDKVILSYWESDTSKDGLIDDVPAWKAMWDTVVGEFQHTPNVYFEPMNEPHGYTLGQWIGVTSQWLTDHQLVPRNRVVISGAGYNDNVVGVGDAPQLKGTLLSLHFYGYWADHTTEADWTADLTARIGAYAGRTIIDEAGSPMTIGLNYGAHNGNVYTSYLAAVTDFARQHRMGIVYWPGLRAGDSYSIESLQPDGTLTDNSVSGVAQLKWGYGYGDQEPVNDLPAAPPGQSLVGQASGRCVDVPGFSTTPGTALDLWDCNGGGNQAWNLTADQQLTIYGNLCLQAGTDGITSAAGDQAVIADCTGTAVQRWSANSDGTITPAAAPTLCLDAAGAGTGNGTAVDLWHCNGAPNQVWVRK